MTCSPSLGWLCRSTSCASFPPRMRSQLQGSDLYPGGSTSHWIHQPSPGHTVRLLSPEPMVVKQPQFTRVKEPTLLCNQVRPSTHMDGKSVNGDLRITSGLPVRTSLGNNLYCAAGSVARVRP